MTRIASIIPRIRQRFIQLKTENSSLAQEVGSYQRQIDSLRQRLETCQRQIASLSQQLGAGQEENRNLRQINLKLKISEQHYREQALRDDLTGISNQRNLFKRMVPELAKALRYKRPLVLAVIDIDHFKCVNDTYGHLAGNMILQELVKVFADCLRKEDIFARYGGDEFVFVLPETHLKDASVPLENVRKKVEGTEFEVDGQKVKITLSIGYAALPEVPKKIDITDIGILKNIGVGLIKKADRALYAAKKDGRNRIRAFIGKKDLIKDKAKSAK
jgi:diguanylate cyclase (GGDEF)-like protein